MYWPKPSTPKRICIRPARMTVANTSDKSPLRDAKTPAKTTIIGPVGPEICEGVPPNRAAKKPTNIAPYTPAIGPAPEASPKARARGSATTPAVRPPKMSPRRWERSKKRFMVIVVLDCGVSRLRSKKVDCLFFEMTPFSRLLFSLRASPSCGVGESSSRHRSPHTNS